MPRHTWRGRFVALAGPVKKSDAGLARVGFIKVQRAHGESLACLANTSRRMFYLNYSPPVGDGRGKGYYICIRLILIFLPDAVFMR